MRIIDIPGHKYKKELLMLDKETSLSDAIARMKELNYGAVIVIDHAHNDKLCGMFTERDLLMKVVAEGKDVTSLKLQDVMTKKVHTAKVDDPIHECMQRMTQGHFRHLPILDEDGKITGLVSQGDLVAVSWFQLFQQLKEKTQLSFNTYTQFWIFVLSLMLYIAVMIKILR